MGDLTIENIRILLQEQTSEIKNSFKQDLNDLNYKVHKYELKIQQLEKHSLIIERKIRKNNIVVFGLKVNDAELVQDTLRQINALLGLRFTINDVNNIYKIGKSEKPPIVIEFLSFYKKLEVFKDKEKLKGLKASNVAISNDLCAQDRREQRILRNHLKKARENNLPARIKGQKIQIDGEWYTTAQLEQTDSEEEYESYGEDSVEDNDQVSLREAPGNVTGTGKHFQKNKADGNNYSKKDKRKRTEQTPSPGLSKRILRKKKKTKH